MGHFKEVLRESKGYEWVDDMALDAGGKAFNGNIVPVVAAVLFIVTVFFGVVL